MTWWTALPLTDGQERTIVLGPLTLRLARTGGLIRVAHHTSDEDLPDVTIGAPVDVEPVGDDFVVERFAGAPAAELRLTPMTADRPVVSRPEVPLVVLPGGRLDVFVSTPVWVAVQAGAATLVELPVRRPKPTFFGTPTRGTLAWAMRTLMRVDLTKLEPRPHRAITPVEIHNAGADPLRVERLQIPVRRLSVHADPQGRLWTRTIVLQRRHGQEHAQVDLGRPGPGPVLGVPREPDGLAHPVLNVFNSVFT